MRRGDARRKPLLELGVLLLINEVYNVGFDKIPPVTLFTIIGQTLLYTDVINLPWSTLDICISAHKVWNLKNWKPLIWANFVHGDDMHLYYNMISFLVKGLTLEKRYGSQNFAFLLGVLTLMTSSIYVGLGILASEVFDDSSYLKACAVGFSGVIFALKMITTIESPDGYTNVAGITVPKKYAAWAELLAIHFLVPNASFVGHLAGILAGLIYLKTPFKYIIDGTISAITGNRIYHGNYDYYD